MIGIQLENNPLRVTDKVEVRTEYSGYIKRFDAPNVPADAQRLSLPKLEAEASRDEGGNVYLMVVNQDANDDVSAKIGIEGLKAAGEAEVWTLNGPTVTALN